MRTFLGAIISLILLSQCNNDKNNNFELKISNISAAIDDTLKEFSWNANFHMISLSLENNTDSTIQFWMNSCSWNDNFLSNDTNIYVLGPLECPGNFPKLFTIDANNKLNFNSLLAVDDTFNLAKEIKIGFIYIKSDEESRIIEITPPVPGDSLALIRHNTHDKIIWSDPFMIK